MAMTQPTTLKNVTISNAPTKSGSEECLTSLAYPQYEFWQFERRFGLN